MTFGLEKAPHRSLLYALGLTREEMKRPLIGVVNAANEVVPGHLHLGKIAEAVKAGIRMAGGTPMEFPAIAVCDGLAMNHEGMRFSLTSREVITDSIEIMATAHPFDALVFIPNCDKIDLGKADLLRDGSDVTLIASGVCVANALQAAETLAQEGVSARVLNIHTIKPIDADAVIKAASETGALVTAENHNVIGGLGSAVAEVLAEQRPTPLERVGVKDHFGQVGKAPYLMGVFGITAADIAKAARKAIARK